jgi:diaminopimelate decarboxylase
MAVIPVSLQDNGSTPTTWDIVGAICETGDFLAKNRVLSLGDNQLLAITGAGAYGFTMSSNYNSRPRACEVLIKAGQVHLIRERETVESLWERETLL